MFFLIYINFVYLLYNNYNDLNHNVCFIRSNQPILYYLYRRLYSLAAPNWPVSPSKSLNVIVVSKCIGRDRVCDSMVQI